MEISVRRTIVTTTRSGLQVGRTKTISSKRAIPLNLEILKELREYKAWQDNLRIGITGWNTEKYIFANSTGGLFNPDVVTQWFVKFIRRIGLPQVNLHSLRHTAATLMLSHGIPIHTVSQILGHALTSTTLNMYGQDRFVAASFMGEFMRKAETKKII